MNIKNTGLFLALSLTLGVGTSTVHAMHPGQLKLLSEVSMPDVQDNEVAEVALEENAAQPDDAAPAAPETRWQKCTRVMGDVNRGYTTITELLDELLSLKHKLNGIDAFISHFYIHYFEPQIGVKKIQKLQGYTISPYRSVLDPLLIKAGISPKNITILQGGDIAWTDSSILCHYPLSSSISPHTLIASAAHETMHIKNKDPHIRIITTLLAAFIVPRLLKYYSLVIKNLIDAIKDKVAPEEQARLHKMLTWIEQKHTAACCSTNASLLIEQLLFQKLSRYLEKRADIQAAHLYPEYNVAHYLAERLKGFIDDPIHPPIAERIAYLTNIAAKQALAKSA